jgi:hypothetical protein
MKPFDLERAKAGDPVITRDGRPVRILCFDGPHEDHPIVGMTGTNIMTFTDAGSYLTSFELSVDLFMATTKKEGWVCIHRNAHGFLAPGTAFCASKAVCEEYGTKIYGSAFVAAAKIEWEE